ncbi:DUF429 domain-containing protein [Sinorhizobium numidicum]|uniref:DUF429 domain-containing protein n=1 Tax=Sinorhizobium numidicum TaxID=680248 RepID=A0ABY8D284_9HYPH|nr:DUF429 domain-containing protein [Sinorhizobium numidicum]WEX77133.1 DUF429 domain-containing protein [Sinorhizobium numidicum]WEX83792.1 DUF429 domain-containing protein [Sinorhizobium numidicum]
MDISVIAHCDWSIDRSKRWMTVAVSKDGRWIIAMPEPVGDTASLIDRLQHRAQSSGAVLIGFDFPIGLPEWYGRQTGFASFRDALAGFGRGPWAEWYDVADHRDRISIRRPFYPMRPGGTSRAHLFDALGIDTAEDLLRRCERATRDRQAACMLFWTLGGNQVGKAALAGWREIILPRLGEVGLWPFDGNLPKLVTEYPVVLAETYPGDVYGQLGIPRRPAWSKRQQSGRRAVGSYLMRWAIGHRHVDTSCIHSLIENGFGAGKTGEDRFDATIGLLGMLDVATDYRSEGAPGDEAITIWEGWILGQAGSAG